MSTAATNLAALDAAEDAHGLDREQRISVAYMMLGYLAGNVDEETWQRALDCGLRHVEPRVEVRVRQSEPVVTVEEHDG